MRIHWIIFLVVYLGFFFWYTNLSGPLSEEEIDLVIDRINNGETTISEEDKSNFIKFLRNDDGGDFYMVKYY